MSATRDPDQLFRAFLDEGPEVLPDRVLAAIADDVHRQGQRAPLRPWRFTPMRTYLAAAAVVLILVVGGGILWANRDSLTGSSSPQPTATVAGTASPVPEPAVGELVPGETYRTNGFSQPFTFTLPDGFDVAVRADTWTGGGTFRLRPGTNGGAITFHDDVALLNDICEPTRTLEDVPDDVAAWLAVADQLSVSEPQTLGNATYWDIELGGFCQPFGVEQLPESPVVWFNTREHHRIYDIVIGDDHVLIFTWGAGYNGEGDEVLTALNPLTDELVGSIQSAGD